MADELQSKITKLLNSERTHNEAFVHHVLCSPSPDLITVSQHSESHCKVIKMLESSVEDVLRLIVNFGVPGRSEHLDRPLEYCIERLPLHNLSLST